MSTFAVLKTRVADILNRTDLTTPIPTWITQAQRKLERANWKCMQKHSTTTGADSRILMPTDYKETIWFKVVYGGAYYELEHTNLRDVLNRFPATAQTGLPEVFATDNATSEFLLGPAPDTTYTFDLFYYCKLAALSQDTDTNWWTTNAEELLVYGALLEGSAYLVSDPRIPMWRDFYSETYAALRKSEADEEYSGSGLAVKADYVI